MTELYNTQKAADFLGYKKNTLEIWRYNNTGPKYSKFGKEVRYRVSDLEKYIDDHAVDPSEQEQAA